MTNRWKKKFETSVARKSLTSSSENITELMNHPSPMRSSTSESEFTTCWSCVLRNPYQILCFIQAGTRCLTGRSTLFCVEQWTVSLSNILESEDVTLDMEWVFFIFNNFMPIPSIGQKKSNMKNYRYKGRVNNKSSSKSMPRVLQPNFFYILPRNLGFRLWPLFIYNKKKIRLK